MMMRTTHTRNGARTQSEAAAVVDRDAATLARAPPFVDRVMASSGAVAATAIARPTRSNVATARALAYTHVCVRARLAVTMMVMMCACACGCARVRFLAYDVAWTGVCVSAHALA